MQRCHWGCSEDQAGQYKKAAWRRKRYAESAGTHKREKKDREDVTYEGIYNDIDARDRKDINDGNFIKPKNAIEIDTTKLSRNEILDIMLLNIKNILRYIMVQLL